MEKSKGINYEKVVTDSIKACEEREKTAENIAKNYALQAITGPSKDKEEQSVNVRLYMREVAVWNEAKRLIAYYMQESFFDISSPS